MTRKLRNLLLGLIIVAIIACSAAFMTARRRSNYWADEVKCHNQIRALGQSMLLYANDYKGRFPDALVDLMVTQDITPEVFVCPHSTDTVLRPQRLDDEAIARFRNSPEAAGADAPPDPRRHCSYIYLGRGKNNTVSPDTVLVYEPLCNHDGMAHALFGDGHVDYLSRDELQVALTGRHEDFWHRKLPGEWRK